MERMGVEYQRFDGKEYVSLRRYYNLLCKYKTLEKENKKLKEDVDFFYKSAKQFREENEKLREELSKKSMGAWFDKKAKNIFMGQDTLQELRDIGEI